MLSRKETKALAQTRRRSSTSKKRARKRVTPEAGELEATRSRRAAEAIQSALLTQTRASDPARVFLVRNGKVAAQERQVRFELAME